MDRRSAGRALNLCIAETIGEQAKRVVWATGSENVRECLSCRGELFWKVLVIDAICGGAWWWCMA